MDEEGGAIAALKAGGVVACWLGQSVRDYHRAIKWGDTNFAFVQLRRLRGHPLWLSP